MIELALEPGTLKGGRYGTACVAALFASGKPGLHYGSPVAALPLAQSHNADPQLPGKDLLGAIAFIQEFHGIDFELLAVTFAAAFDFRFRDGVMAHFLLTFRLLIRVRNTGANSG